MEIKDKVAVVIGATGGMGEKLCELLYKEGAKLVLVSHSKEKLEALARKFGGCLFCDCDLTKPETIYSVCDRIVAENSEINFLFNVAGIGVYKLIEEVEEKEWLDSFNVDVTANFYFLKYLLPALRRAEKGIVVNWGSGMGVIPTAGRSVYCTAKFALRGMSLSLAKEFARTNIKIIHLTLGSVLTEFGPMTLEEKKRENLEGKAYLTPEWVTEKAIEIIKKDEFKDEIELFPADYVEGIR